MTANVCLQIVSKAEVIKLSLNRNTCFYTRFIVTAFCRIALVSPTLRICNYFKALCSGVIISDETCITVDNYEAFKEKLK